MSNSGGEDSEDRYKKLKKQEAGTGKTEAEKRFQELKEEAKEEFIRKQKQREQERQKEEQQDDDKDKFVTY